MSYYNKTATQRLAEESPQDYKDFASRFEANIEDSNTYKQYVRRMPYHMWDGKLPLDAEVQVVPMKCIHLSSENLERLVREYDRMDSLRDEANYAKTILTKLRKDEQVRYDNPAVAKAYRNYEMLLELARK